MKVDRRHVVAGLAVSVAPIGRHYARAATGAITLEAAPATLRLAGTAATDVWAYNTLVPGPLLRVKKGEGVDVKLVNKLNQPTSLCWHGVRIINSMDGVAGLTQKPVMPGESFDYRFTPPDSGCFWYHPHAWPSSAEQIGRGLYGVLIVDEAEPPAVDDDLLVVISDWVLDDRGRIEDTFHDPQPARPGGRTGALLTVNGKPVPDERTIRPGARIRLRLLNACSERIAILGFVGLQTTVIAIDGQPSEIFKPARDAVPLGPGSRVELMLDVPGGSTAPASLNLLEEGRPDRKLLGFVVAGPAVPARGAVTKLPDNPLLPTRIALERSLKRQLPIGRMAQSGKPSAAKPIEARVRAALWTLDGRPSDGFSGSPLFTVKRGSPVTLAFLNQTDAAQQMHVHGHVFRVLHDLDDGWDPYWRDSILIAPGKTKHVAFVADNLGRWAIESLMLDRQVTGLAGYFLVA